jgi:hypothetical protein
MRNILIFSIIIGVFGFNGCSSGKNIEVKQVRKIHKGRTTEKQIRKMFGEPTAVDFDYKRHRKTLIYRYTNSDSGQKALVGTGATIAGALMGPVGLVAGLAVANNVQARVEYKELNIIINTRTHRVIDYNFSIRQGRTSGMGIGGSIGGI